MTTAPPSSDCQVLVVGAGPTGLTLAAQLLARGIRTRIIDKAEGPAPHSRAIGIHARTLELLDTMGLAEDFLGRGHRVAHLRMYAGGRRLLNLNLAHNGSRYPFVLHLPQSETEVLLRARVRELGGSIEQGVELVRLTGRADVVDATVRDRAGREAEISAGYVVGCDGAHSRVRHELEIAFTGQPYPNDWLLADVALQGAGSPDAVHLFFRPDGLPLTCIPMGGHRWRLVMANAGDRGGRAPSFDEIQDAVAQRAPWPIEVSDPVWLGSFRCHLRSASTYRRGRVLLAGDAAHIHSPAGGQGMNTGMIDAQNLAWKLALVVGGRAPDGLLDTYGQERVPVASGVLELTDRIVGLMTMRNPAKRALRDAVLPVATSLPPVQRRAARRLSQVSVAYPPGPLVLPDREQAGHAAHGDARPGERAPDIAVHTPGGTSRLYEQLRAGRHVLVASSADEVAALDDAGMTREELVSTVIGRFGGGGVALIRPDGVVAARSRDGVAEYLHGFARELVPAEEESRPAAVLGTLSPRGMEEARQPRR
jgi:2-polyprenyl-6-methoxyphenol hydroxylase-like FAD-dependent oxidoreductase